MENGTVIDLGVLGGADSCSVATSINEKGESAGTSENGVIDPLIGLNEVRAVVWNEVKIEDLGTFGGNESAASAINHRGQVVGMALNATPDPFSLFEFLLLGFSNGTQTRAFLWQNGVMQDLGTLGGPDSSASVLNERGQVLGVSYTNSVPNSTTGFPTLHPVVWENGRMTDLGTLGGTVAGGIALNNHGQVVGVSNLAGDPGCLTPNGCVTDVFLWTHGKMIDLTASTIGGTFLAATQMNDAGEIVGSGSFSGRVFDAALWRSGLLNDLGTLDGDCFSFAENIDSSGRVVGQSFSCDFRSIRGFLWENGSIVDLNSLIAPDSGLQVVRPLTINGHGEIPGNGIVPGSGCQNASACAHAFLLIPVCGDSAEGCFPASVRRRNSCASGWRQFGS